MATESTDLPTLELNRGGPIPVLGFGTWQLTGRACYDAVRTALDVGYRHLDTATAYDNEEEVGRAVRDSGVPRADIFITTKLPPARAGHARETIDESLRKLGTDYVDLWLIHWPTEATASVPTWRELLAAHDAGLSRAVGVSNYSPALVDQLIEETGIAPAVNQIPWSPRQFDARALAHARERDVVIEGYSPFKGSNLSDPILQSVAAVHNVTTAQVILRWHLQHDVVVIPKSATAARIATNFDITGFSLDDEELARIDTLAD